MGKGWALERYECAGNKRQEEHPYLLTPPKALRRKKEHRNGKDGKRRRKGPLDPGLGKTKNTGMETGGDYHMGPMTVQRRASEKWVEPRQHVHYP